MKENERRKGRTKKEEEKCVKDRWENQNCLALMEVSKGKKQRQESKKKEKNVYFRKGLVRRWMSEKKEIYLAK